MKRILLITLALGAAACEAEPVVESSGDVFWVEIIDANTACPDVEITTNFNATVNQVSNIFSVMSTTEESIGGDYAYVTRGENGDVLFNWRGQVLTGTEANNGEITVSWINEETTTQTAEAEGFLSTRVDERTIEQTLIFRPNNNEEAPEFSGTYSRRDYELLQMTETDEWDFFATGLGTQVGETENFLTWIDDPPGQGNSNVRNRSFLDDCLLADECTFRYAEDCTRQFTVEAILLDGADIDVFDAIDAFDQPNGVN